MISTNDYDFFSRFWSLFCVNLKVQRFPPRATYLILNKKIDTLTQADFPGDSPRAWEKELVSNKKKTILLKLSKF